MRIIAKMWTRKCRGCPDISSHTHHLTRFGSWYFAARSRRGPIRRALVWYDDRLADVGD